MNQYFSHYENWEDHKNGMYQLSCIDKHKKVIGAIEVLCNNDIFYSTLINVLSEWPVSTKVNLTNLNQNRKAWLGAAACCYLHKTPEFLTRIAWGLLNTDEQNKANLVAEKIIKEYERKNFRVHKDMGEKMLF